MRKTWVHDRQEEVKPSPKRKEKKEREQSSGGTPISPVGPSPCVRERKGKGRTLSGLGLEIARTRQA